MSIPAGSSLPHGPPRSAFTDYAVFIASLFVHGDSLRVSATRTRRTCSVSFVPSRRRFSNPPRPARAPRAPPRTPSRAPPLRASPPPRTPAGSRPPSPRARGSAALSPRPPRRRGGRGAGAPRGVLDDVRPLAAFRPALRPPPLGAHVAGQTGVPDDDAAVREGLVDDLARARALTLALPSASAARSATAARIARRNDATIGSEADARARRPPPRASDLAAIAPAAPESPGPRRSPGRSASRGGRPRPRARRRRRGARRAVERVRVERRGEGRRAERALETAVTETRRRVMVVSRRRAAHANGGLAGAEDAFGA